jgi:hypothetical protein
MYSSYNFTWYLINAKRTVRKGSSITQMDKMTPLKMIGMADKRMQFIFT